MCNSLKPACTNSDVVKFVIRNLWQVWCWEKQCVRSLLVYGPLLACAACESTLVVEPYEQGSAVGDASVPFYMARHDFIVADLALDAKGKEVKQARRGIQVSLVTRRDSERAFLVTNKTGLFSGSEFSISRDIRGRLTSISGKSEDKTLETVQALTSVVATAAAAAFISGDSSARQALIDEKTILENITLPFLFENLESAQTVKEIKEIQQALALARGRLAKIKTALHGAAGTKPFGLHAANVEVCQSTSDRDTRIVKLEQTNEKGVYVFLIPAEGAQGEKPCTK